MKKKITKSSRSQTSHIERPFVDKSGSKLEKMGKIMDTTRDVNHPKGGMVKEFKEKLTTKKIPKAKSKKAK